MEKEAIPVRQVASIFAKGQRALRSPTLATSLGGFASRLPVIGKYMPRKWNLAGRLRGVEDTIIGGGLPSRATLPSMDKLDAAAQTWGPIPMSDNLLADLSQAWKRTGSAVRPFPRAKYVPGISASGAYYKPSDHTIGMAPPAIRNARQRWKEIKRLSKMGPAGRLPYAIPSGTTIQSPLTFMHEAGHAADRVLRSPPLQSGILGQDVGHVLLSEQMANRRALGLIQQMSPGHRQFYAPRYHKWRRLQIENYNRHYFQDALARKRLYESVDKASRPWRPRPSPITPLGRLLAPLPSSGTEAIRLPQFDNLPRWLRQALFG